MRPPRADAGGSSVGSAGRQRGSRLAVRADMGTADVVVGVLAAIGVVVLIAVFVYVFRNVMKG